ncbi:hypothetical protein C1H46_009843 [Malus baccata]|uniref:Uncharacterized protein n=1 Tax=Malus baccata TaxID=106549 RepID=A0A540N0H1_MALBA|nr:hypothetical protein C1H46_009843 [Malus baccata]
MFFPRPVSLRRRAYKPPLILLLSRVHTFLFKLGPWVKNHIFLFKFIGPKTHFQHCLLRDRRWKTRLSHHLRRSGAHHHRRARYCHHAIIVHLRSLISTIPQVPQSIFDLEPYVIVDAIFYDWSRETKTSSWDWER